MLYIDGDPSTLIFRINLYVYLFMYQSDMILDFPRRISTVNTRYCLISSSEHFPPSPLY